MHDFGCHFSQERQPSPLQTDTPVVITIGPTAKELSVITAEPALVAQQDGVLQPPAADLQATDLQQPTLASPQVSAGLVSLKAAVAKKNLQEIAATKNCLQSNNFNMWVYLLK